jgi:hypothetical protein
LGRWPVSTAKEVRIVAAKTIAHEESIRDGKHLKIAQQSECCRSPHLVDGQCVTKAQRKQWERRAAIGDEMLPVRV